MAIIEPVDGLPVRSGNEMAIDVHGHLNRVVPHLFLHILGGLALLQAVLRTHRSRR